MCGSFGQVYHIKKYKNKWSFLWYKNHVNKLSFCEFLLSKFLFDVLLLFTVKIYFILTLHSFCYLSKFYSFVMCGTIKKFNYKWSLFCCKCQKLKYLSEIMRWNLTNHPWLKITPETRKSFWGITCKTHMLNSWRIFESSCTRWFRYTIDVSFSHIV